MTNIKLLKIGEVLPINEELAGLVPMASMEEQASLTDDISRNGLREPVVLWKGKIVDGRCRQKACIASNTKIMARELDNELSENDVKIFVKSVNTRRNLTQTQKIMVATRQKLNKENTSSIPKTAKEWGVGVAILNNALYIAKNKPEFVEPLFDGRTVLIINNKGEEVSSNKITAIYAYIKREHENAKENNDHGWKEDSYIKTQKGKEWFYDKIKELNIIDMQTKFLIAELANYKFKKEENEKI